MRPDWVMQIWGSKFKTLRPLYPETTRLQWFKKRPVVDYLGPTYLKRNRTKDASWPETQTPVHWLTSRPDCRLALAINQSAHADLTHPQLILRQTGVIGVFRSSDSKRRPAIVKTCAWGLWTPRIWYMIWYTVPKSTWKWSKIRIIP